MTKDNGGERFREDKEMERKVLTGTDFIKAKQGGRKSVSKEPHSGNLPPPNVHPPPFPPLPCPLPLAGFFKPRPGFHFFSSLQAVSTQMLFPGGPHGG